MVIMAIGILAMANKPMAFNVHQAKPQADHVRKDLDEPKADKGGNLGSQ